MSVDTSLTGPAGDTAALSDAAGPSEADLLDALLCLGDREELRRFLVDLLTPRELRDLSDRWAVAQRLHRGQHSYRAISSDLGVSTTTVGRVARFLNDEPHQGYRIALDRLAPAPADQTPTEAKSE